MSLERNSRNLPRVLCSEGNALEAPQATATDCWIKSPVEEREDLCFLMEADVQVFRTKRSVSTKVLIAAFVMSRAQTVLRLSAHKIEAVNLKLPSCVTLVSLPKLRSLTSSYVLRASKVEVAVLIRGSLF